MSVLLKVVVFSPHPDDDILGCGGTIALRVQEGYEVHVIFMTDGRNSHLYGLGIASNPSPCELAQIRREEAMKAQAVLGVGRSNLHFLDFEDGALAADLKAAKQEVLQLLIALRPQEVYFPTKSDRHCDHWATSTVISEALESIGFHGTAYQYTIWRDQVKGASLHAEKLVDISAVLSLKERALRKHQSQVAIFSAGQETAVLDDSFIAGFMATTEVFEEWAA